MKYIYSLIAIIFAGCVTDQGVSLSKDSAAKYERFHFPERLESYDFSHQIDYEKIKPENGIMRSYKNSEVGAISIYVYDKGYKQIEDGVDSERVIQEFVTTALESSLHGGIDPEKIESSIAKPDMFEVDDISFWMANWKKTYGERETVNYLLIRGYNGNFLKIRITLYSDTEIIVKEELENIVREIITDMIVSPNKSLEVTALAGARAAPQL